MVDIDIEYQGDLHCRATHGPSASVLETDAPVDNHGRGEAFSPTDLVATGLGTCMATLMGIRARERDVTLTGTRLRVRKHVTATPPRRIARLAVDIVVPAEIAAAIDEPTREVLERAALTCPVRLGLNDAIDVPVRFDWRG